jgi:cell division protein FtsL
VTATQRPAAHVAERAPRAPDAPRRPPEPARRSQEAPRRSQEAPRRSQEAPRGPAATAPRRGRPAMLWSTASAPLRLVLPGELSPRARERRVRQISVVAGLLTTLVLFGVVIAHVVLAQQQFRLSVLQGQMTDAQAANQRLALQVSQLESPARVVAAAEQQLGMVTPPTVAYLSPGQPPAAHPVKAAPAPATTVPTSSSASTPTTRPNTTPTTRPTSTPTTTPRTSVAGGATRAPAAP